MVEKVSKPAPPPQIDPFLHSLDRAFWSHYPVEPPQFTACHVGSREMHSRVYRVTPDGFITAMLGEPNLWWSDPSALRMAFLKPSTHESTSHRWEALIDTRVAELLLPPHITKRPTECVRDNDVDELEGINAWLDATLTATAAARSNISSLTAQLADISDKIESSGRQEVE